MAATKQFYSFSKTSDELWYSSVVKPFRVGDARVTSELKLIDNINERS